jgi:hypothetical protein
MMMVGRLVWGSCFGRLVTSGSTVAFSPYIASEMSIYGIYEGSKYIPCTARNSGLSPEAGYLELTENLTRSLLSAFVCS